MRRDEPDLFERAMQDTLNHRRAELGRDPVYLTRFARPLLDAIAADQDLRPLIDDGCDGRHT